MTCRVSPNMKQFIITETDRKPAHRFYTKSFYTRVLITKKKPCSFGDLVWQIKRSWTLWPPAPRTATTHSRQRHHHNHHNCYYYKKLLWLGMLRLF